MKMPREILLERHRTAVPKLDVIRQSVISDELNKQATKEQSPGYDFVSWFLCCSRILWRELIWPSRRIWAGLAAIWLLIFTVNFSLRDRAPAMAMKSAPAPQMMLTFRQQERLLTELIGPDETTADQPATPVVPQPRSEGRLEILMT